MDRSELERELERLHPESWGWALACTARDRDMAQDALQTAYVRILGGTARHDGRSSFKTWLFGVIRFSALEELRRRRQTDGSRNDEAVFDVADSRPGPDAIAERAERAAALVAALATLSPRQSQVLHLVFYHGMTIDEAAVVMHLSIGSARTHYDRGKKALAAALSDVHGEVR